MNHRTSETANLTVLHVMGALRPSGMERMLVSAAPYFANLGVESSVVGQGEVHPFTAELKAAGYVVYRVPDVRRTLRGGYHLFRLMRRVRPDIVHVHTEGAYLLIVLISVVAIRSRRVVHTVHNVFFGSRAWRVKRRLQVSVADRFVGEVIVPSPDVEANERHFGRNARVIYNWVDQRFFELRPQRRIMSRPEGPARFVLIGNCGPAKSHEMALRAALRIPASISHVGDESHASDEERSLLSELEQRGRLNRRGAQPPDDALLEADCFLMPSRNEGMGVALAEAITVGLPSLVADAPGLRWAAGQPAVVVVQPDPASWATALRTFVAPQDASQSQSRLDFSPARGATEYVEVYRRLTRP